MPLTCCVYDHLLPHRYSNWCQMVEPCNHDNKTTWFNCLGRTERYWYSEVLLHAIYLRVYSIQYVTQNRLQSNLDTKNILQNTVISHTDIFMKFWFWSISWQDKFLAMLDTPLTYNIYVLLSKFSQEFWVCIVSGFTAVCETCKNHFLSTIYSTLTNQPPLWGLLCTQFKLYLLCDYMK